MCNSKKGTGGMESSVVLFNRTSSCSHALILLPQSRWTEIICCTNISRQPVFKHIWIVVGGSLSAHTHQYPACCSNTFGSRFCVGVQTSVYSPLTEHVWNVILVVCKHHFHFVFQTRSECGSLSTYMHQLPAP